MSGLPEEWKKARRFLSVGSLNTVAGYSVIFGLTYTGSPEALANAAGYGLGLMLSFLLNASWTFDYNGHRVAALIRFLGVFALAYCANLGSVLIALRMEFNPYLAQATGLVPYTFVFYLGSRYYAFARRCQAIFAQDEACHEQPARDNLERSISNH